jgi:hypothetical protein
VRIRILEYTDLVTPQREVTWSRQDKGYVVFDRAYQEDHSSQFFDCWLATRGASNGCFCRRRHAAFSLECKCWAPPGPGLRRVLVCSSSAAPCTTMPSTSSFPAIVSSSTTSRHPRRGRSPCFGIGTKKSPFRDTVMDTICSPLPNFYDMLCLHARFAISGTSSWSSLLTNPPAGLGPITMRCRTGGQRSAGSEAR